MAQAGAPQAATVGRENGARGGHGWHVLAILSALMGFASISTDLYLPAMPAMAGDLGAGVGASEWTVSGYLIGFSLGQLFWGPVGDRFGRKVPVAIGIVLFVLGSAGCAMGTTIWAVIAARMVQAVGASAGVVLGRAMVRDLFAGPRAASMMSTLMTVMAVAPLLGPLLGGQILLLAGWRAIFDVLAGFGLLSLLALTLLPETLPPERRTATGAAQAVVGYARLLRDPRLLAYAGAGAFFYAGMFAYIAGSPFAYIRYHGLAPQHYGWLFGLGVVGIMASNMVNARLVARFGVDAMLRGGTVLAAVFGLGVGLVGATDLGGLAGLVAALFLFASATGLIVANSIAGAMDLYPDRAGTVSALVGALQYGSGIFSSALTGALADGTPMPMSAIILVTGIASCACALAIGRAVRAR